MRLTTSTDRMPASGGTIGAALALLLLVSLGVQGCNDGSLTLKGNYVGDEVLNTDDPDGPNTGPDDPERVVVGNKSLQVDSPLPQAIIDRQVVQVVGQADGIDTVKINGTEVDVEDGAFSRNVPATTEGPMQIVVEGEGLPAITIPVIVDLSPPVVVVNEPPRGAFINEGQPVTVRGQVSDSATEVSEVVINGQATAVGPDGSFSATLTPTTGTNFIKVDATDGAGRPASRSQAFVYGQFAPWDRPSDDAINARLRADALSMLTDALATTLVNDLLGDFTSQDNGDVEIRGISFSELDIALTPAQGYLDIQIRMFDLVVEVAVEQRVVFFDVTISGDVSTNPAELTGKLYLDLDGQGGLSARIADSNVRLHNFDLDLDGLAGLLEGLVEGTVEDLATDLLRDVLDEGVIGTLLDPGGLRQEFDLLGQTAVFNLLVTQLDIDPQGVTFGTDSTMEVAASPDVPPSPGYLITPAGPPQTPSPERMVRLSLSDDFINQLLGSLWRGGALNIDIGEALAGDEGEEGGGGLPVDLTAGTFALLVGNDLLDHAERDTPVGLVMRPLLPPITRVQSPEQGVLGITIGDMILDFSLKNPDGEVHWASVATQLIIDIRMELDEQGEMTTALELRVEADLIEEPLFDIDDVTLEQLLVSLLETLPDQLDTDDAFDLGDLSGNNPGVGIGNLLIRPDGPGKDYLSIYVDFVPEF